MHLKEIIHQKIDFFDNDKLHLISEYIHVVENNGSKTISNSSFLRKCKVIRQKTAKMKSGISDIIYEDREELL